MDNSKNKFLKNLEHKEDSIWGNVYDYGKQKQEKILREEYANNKKYGDYLSEIKYHHSIPVMDNEVKKFLNLIPKNGVILDIGGCWGWHWRNINNVRPDIKIIILDLIRENLIHAKKLLNELIDNQQIFLIHGNATDLKFEDEIFDGVWSVQTTQHIPNFFNVCNEIHRVLKPKGIYWDYSLNNAEFTRAGAVSPLVSGEAFGYRGGYVMNDMVTTATERNRPIITFTNTSGATRKIQVAVFLGG